MIFRKLKADEIECRIGSINSRGFTMLLYKDARCDMNILDETVGEFNWQRDHKEIKGTIYCGVGIFHGSIEQIGQGVNPWVWKWDAGSESYTEKEKGKHLTVLNVRASTGALEENYTPRHLSL